MASNYSQYLLGYPQGNPNPWQQYGHFQPQMQQPHLQHGSQFALPQAYTTPSQQFYPALPPVAPLPAPQDVYRPAPQSVPVNTLPKQTATQSVFPSQPDMTQLLQALMNEQGSSVKNSQNLYNQPVTESLDHEPKSNALKALALIKIVAGGIIVGGLSAFMFAGKAQAAKVLIPFDMALGAMETLLAKKVMDGNSTFSQKLFDFSARFTPLKGKSQSQMTDHEKEKALGPISAMVTVISTLLTAGLGEKIEHMVAHPNEMYFKEGVWCQIEKVVKKIMGPEHKTGLWGKLQGLADKSAELVPKISKKSALANSLVSFNTLLNRNDFTKYGKAAVVGLGLGLLEGVLAKKLAQKEDAKAAKA